MTEIFIFIVIRILLCLWCCNVADKNNRNTNLAIFLTVMFGIWAIIGYYVAGKEK